jgi:hypothetical protein
MVNTMYPNCQTAAHVGMLAHIREASAVGAALLIDAHAGETKLHPLLAE